MKIRPFIPHETPISCLKVINVRLLTFRENKSNWSKISIFLISSLTILCKNKTHQKLCFNNVKESLITSSKARMPWFLPTVKQEQGNHSQSLEKIHPWREFEKESYHELSIIFSTSRSKKSIYISCSKSLWVSTKFITRKYLISFKWINDGTNN